MSRGLHPNLRFRSTRGFYPIADASGVPDSVKSSMARTWIRQGFKLAPCQGEAHSNPMIDNCSRCAPLWEWVVVPETAPLSAAEVDALARFAAEYGERWKTDLALAWHRSSAEPTLHRLRNTHGGAWLTYVDIDAEIERVADLLVAANEPPAVACKACESIAALERAGTLCPGEATCVRHSVRAQQVYRGGVL